jgi:hypothetical protein
MKLICAAALGLLMTALGGCTAARIAVAPELASTAETLSLSGMGFGQRGKFTLGASSGTFTRHALSAKATDPFPADDFTSFFGDGSFSVQGADFTGRVEASCRYLEAIAEDRPAEVTTIPFHYRCTFSRDGRPIDASLTLQAAPRRVGPLLTETRSGRFVIEGRSVGIVPIHHSTQLRIPTSEPLGYRFIRDGSDLGAIDLNGERKTIYAPKAGSDRETVLMAGLALSVLWRD